jgi:hypothetical protein
MGVSPRSGEVGQRQLSSFVGIFGNLREAATYRIGLRPGSDGFAFKLVGKRHQPALYFGVPGHPSQLAALCDFIAQSFNLGHPCTCFEFSSEDSYFEWPSNFAMLRPRITCQAATCITSLALSPSANFSCPRQREVARLS